MAESLSSPGIDPPSPTLSARLRELADYLGAPLAGRLTEEQRALSLGIARRLVTDAARTLDEGLDGTKLWADWLDAGLPTAARLAPACFARAEEHRWREGSAKRPGAPDGDAGNADTARPSPPERAAAADSAYLALRIADRRRFDDQGHPRIAIADVDADLLRALLRDIAAWRVLHADVEPGPAANPESLVERALDRRAFPSGLDRAAADYYAAFDASEVGAEAALAIASHDWLALIALAAASSRRTYSDMALALISADPAALPSLLAPLRLDRASLAPLEAALAALPGRAEESLR